MTREELGELIRALRPSELRERVEGLPLELLKTGRQTLKIWTTLIWTGGALQAAGFFLLTLDQSSFAALWAALLAWTVSVYYRLAWTHSGRMNSPQALAACGQWRSQWPTEAAKLIALQAGAALLIGGKDFSADLFFPASLVLSAGMALWITAAPGWGALAALTRGHRRQRQRRQRAHISALRRWKRQTLPGGAA